MWLHGVIFLACLALVGNGYGCGSSHFLNSGLALPSVSIFLTQAVGLTPESTSSQHQVCSSHFLHQVGSAPLQSLTLAPGDPLNFQLDNAFGLGFLTGTFHHQNAHGIHFLTGTLHHQTNNPFGIHFLTGTLHQVNNSFGIHFLTGTLHHYQLDNSISIHFLTGTLHHHQFNNSIGFHFPTGTLHHYKFNNSIGIHLLTGTLHCHQLNNSIGIQFLTGTFHHCMFKLNSLIDTHLLTGTLHPCKFNNSFGFGFLTGTLHGHCNNSIGFGHLNGVSCNQLINECCKSWLLDRDQCCVSPWNEYEHSRPKVNHNLLHALSVFGAHRQALMVPREGEFHCSNDLRVTVRDDLIHSLPSAFRTTLEPPSNPH